MKKKYLTVIFLLAASCAVAAWIFMDDALLALKARGYLEYTPEEAVAIAYDKCSRCHSSEKVVNYCPRCGPPFVVAVHNMRTLISMGVGNPGEKGFPVITDAEAVAITQVWNALIGNWEEGWRREDLTRLLENDIALIRLLDIPPQDRKLEAALYGKDAPGAQYEGGFDFRDKKAKE